MDSVPYPKHQSVQVPVFPDNGMATISKTNGMDMDMGYSSCKNIIQILFVKSII